ncbi:MAG TPA: PQQ-dependent sugar dehydrogenase, partial [Myxococcota bacterium]|nr:PQQ-dependent sugar dehydrogenase [Myxococcota bacterium]
MRNALWALLCLASLVAAHSRAADPSFDVVTSDTDNPSYLADPNDGTGRLFITELGGHVRILQNGTLQAQDAAFLDVSGSVAFGGAGEGGMHSMAFDPNFASNHFVYVEYTVQGDGGSPLKTRIERYTVDPNDPDHADMASVHTVLVQESPVGSDFSNHKGGQLQFGPDGFLYFAFGDGGSGDDPGCRSQTRNLLFGKMLRIDPNGADLDPNDPDRNYAIPMSNPFRNDPNYAPEIWDLGLRNPYRFSFDRETGELWIGDVGQSTREEVDMESRFNDGGGGRNYGWKVFEGTTCHFPDPQGAGNCPAYVGDCNAAGYTMPVNDYGRGVGSTIIGGFVYRGASTAWQGKYIFADYGSSTIFSLTPNGSGGFTRDTIPAPNVHNAISFGEDHTGELYVLAGNVYKISFPPGISFTKQQQACVRKLNAGYAALADARSAQIRTCIDRFASGKLGGNSIDQCIDAPSPKLEKLAAKNGQTETDQCTEPLPPFGVGGSAAGNEAALEADVATLIVDTVTETPDDDVILKASDKTGAACQKSVIKTLASCTKAHRSEFLRCKNAGLKDGTFADAGGLADCLFQDPKSRVEKACGSKLASAIDKSCVRKAVDLSTA